MRVRTLSFTATLSTLAVAAALLLPAPASASHYHRGPTAGKSHKGKRGKSATHAATSTPPRAIDDARATEIQTSLVKAGYLPSVSGHWDEASAGAMRKLQGDNGWQTKLIPDSRALIKLGLGPATTTIPATGPTDSSVTGPTGSTSICGANLVGSTGTHADVPRPQ